MMYGRPNHTLITTMERAEGADEGPERSQARTKQRKPSQKVVLVCLQHECLSTEVSRDTSRDMAGEVGRDPLLHRYFWEGLHKNARRAVLRQIEATDTTYDRSKPIDMDIVTEAARYILSDDVFEKDQNNPVAMCLHDLTDDDNSLDDSYGKKKKGRKAIRKKKKLISDLESSDEEDDRKKKKS